ncbi:MFS transporter [Pseudomonas monteilii]|uniref:MFS transporter n=1 Tax=Pseudomonas monteilii TaxID=76759 RepID=UPI00383B2E68
MTKQVEGQSTPWTWRDFVPALACTVLGTAGFAAYMALPMLLGALSEAKAIDSVHLGWVGSGELVGLLLGSLLTARFLGKGFGHSIAFAGSGIAIAANVVTPWMNGIEALIGLRVLAGLGGGLCYAYALARLSSRGNAARNATVFGIGLGLVSSLLFLMIPWLSEKFGIAAVFQFLCLMFLIATLLLRQIPTESAAEAASSSTGGKTPFSASSVICIISVIVWGIATACFWIYTERLGTDAGLTSAFVGQVLNISNLACMVSCLAVYRLTKMWGHHAPQIGILIICGLLCLLWNTSAGEVGYAAQIFIYFQLISITQVLQISLFSYLDKTGRLAALLPAAQGGGQAIGPLVGSAIFASGHGFEGLLFTVGGLLILSALLFAGAFAKTRSAGVRLSDSFS